MPAAISSGVPKASHRVGRSLSIGGRAVWRVRVRRGRAGLNDVDGDAAERQIPRGTLAVADDRGFGRRVVGDTRPPGVKGEL